MNIQKKDNTLSITRRSNSLATKKNENSIEMTENEMKLTNPSISTSIQLTNNQSSLPFITNSLPDSGPFPCEPRIGPKLWRCCRFKRIRKDLLSLNTSNNHRHTISFSVGFFSFHYDIVLQCNVIY